MAEHCSNCSSPVAPGAAPPRSERGKPPKIPGAMTIWKDGQPRYLCPECLPRRKAPAKPKKVKSTEPDPLEGQRKAINENPSKFSIIWDREEFPTAPVKVGDVFELQVGGIEITKIHRTVKAGSPIWRAEFSRSRQQRSYFLGRHGGYTSDPELAMKSQDDRNPTTLDTVGEEESEEHKAAGEPPEPEAIPPGEVAELPSTMTARLRYIEQRDQTHEEDLRRLNSELRELVKRAVKSGIDPVLVLAPIVNAISDQHVGISRAA